MKIVNLTTICPRNQNKKNAPKKPVLYARTNGLEKSAIHADAGNKTIIEYEDMCRSTPGSDV